MIINQWVPAAHKGDAIGDSARRVRDLLRAMGHESELYALTMDDAVRHEVRPFSDRGGEDRRPDDLPLRPAVADDRGVRRAAGGTRPAVPQRDAGLLFRALRSGALPPGGARTRRARDARRTCRPGAGRLGVQPAGARSARLRAHRRLPDCGRHLADHAAGAAPGARPDPGRWTSSTSCSSAGSRRTRRSRTSSSSPKSTSATWTTTTASSSSAGSTSCRGIIR